MIIEERIHIAAPVACVWDLIANPERMPKVSPGLRRIQWIGITRVANRRMLTHSRMGISSWNTW